MNNCKPGITPSETHFIFKAKATYKNPDSSTSDDKQKNLVNCARKRTFPTE